ncbi:MAG: hypothetical protein COV08_03630 [Candidatus Vogelbacteria bacterium CG10_big_fil_rev_8_21_14_0_10_49_38]|uniref:Uncharacterized protein n=1 Tax=Candidatus Vogelbacteria bacterium CG10_big_fil_rev_8_21_14_0_10_49_38 TaxID=1975043 RepID=A0A2H0RH29_9BACT|nr:MAG: hypothetical protein BK006_03620 [bacterium CG10_49_38]PIR45726.1 MAG: hypothetical protein COV08_03630 [Candidatus Vogelbacteria bacterium CG10_big_fil_rev_8_21_14_0_10_49_38]
MERVSQSHQKTKQIFLLGAIILILIVYWWPVISLAQNMPPALPFGGILIQAIPCPVSGNLLLITTPVAGSRFNIFQPGFSRPYSYYQFTRPGAWLLGNTLGVAPCIISLVPFISLGIHPLISIIGTSR